MSGLGDVRISGSGGIDGGEYNKVKISGSGKINGNLICNDLVISGAAKVNGSVSGESVTVSGSCKFKGGVEAKNIKISGSSCFGDRVRGEKIRISGGATVDGDCEAEEITISGAIKVSGLLNAGMLDISLSGNCHAREIGGEQITIKHTKKQGGLISGIVNKFCRTDGELNCDLIEGDEIFLENTISKLVRGNNIEIGKGCIIDTIEYSGILDIHKESQVKDIIKL